MYTPHQLQLQRSKDAGAVVKGGIHSTTPPAPFARLPPPAAPKLFWCLLILPPPLPPHTQVHRAGRRCQRPTRAPASVLLRCSQPAV